MTKTTLTGNGPSRRPAETACFLAGWLIDGTGRPCRSNVLLRVAHGRILSLDPAPCPDGPDRRHDTTPPRQDTEPPAPCTDLSCCTILPPLVDTHVHLFMSGAADPEVRKRQLARPYEEMREAIADHVRCHWKHGVLAVRDGGDYGGYSLRYRDERPHDLPPVRIRSPGRAWRAPGRYGALIGRPPKPGLSLGQAVTEEFSCIQHTHPALPGTADGPPRCPGRRPDHVKIVQSGLNSLLRFGRETPPQFTPHDLSSAVQAAARAGLKTMVHANGRLPVEQAIEAGCHSVEHGFFMARENLERMASRPVTWVPTVFTMEAYAAALVLGNGPADIARKNLDHQLEQIALARQVGVTLATGTDSGSLGVHHGKALRQEIRLFIQAGHSLEAALACATGNGARLLGLDNELGTLCPGMPATFLAVRAHPRDLPADLDRIQGVYLWGQEIQA